MDPSIRTAALSLAGNAEFYKLPQEQRAIEAATALELLGEDGGDPLMVQMCVDEASRMTKRRKTSLLRRLKDALTLYDRDLVVVMGGISRPTVNAYIQGRLAETFDKTDIKNLAALIDQRIASLQELRAELS